MFKQNSLYMLLCLLPLDFLGHQEKLGSFFTPSHQIFIYIYKIPQPLSQDKQPQFFSVSLHMSDT